jgi:hypothetical protein
MGQKSLKSNRSRRNYIVAPAVAAPWCYRAGLIPRRPSLISSNAAFLRSLPAPAYPFFSCYRPSHKCSGHLQCSPRPTRSHSSGSLRHRRLQRKDRRRKQAESLSGTNCDSKVQHLHFPARHPDLYSLDMGQRRSSLRSYPFQLPFSPVRYPLRTQHLCHSLGNEDL